MQEELQADTVRTVFEKPQLILEAARPLGWSVIPPETADPANSA